MTNNSFGKNFTFTTFGESHGEAIGCIIDGVPAGIDLYKEDIQSYLDRRKPGQNSFTTQRKESDKVEILSGVFEHKTTGTPIGLLIKNTDHRSKDYSEIKDIFRPGHGDITYFLKYGIRDYRGGGRSSARETAMRVAVGAVAYKILKYYLGKEFEIEAALIQIGTLACDENNWDSNYINKNPFHSADSQIVKQWEQKITDIRKAGNSLGGIIKVIAKGVPSGVGEPIYNKIDAQIAHAMMSINAVKGVEIGNGFASSELTGYENNDEITIDKHGKIKFLSNNCGGILAGISTGDEIIAKVAFKPTPSILIEQNSINANMENIKVKTKGRHDPCVAIRAVPIVWSMMAISILDSYLETLQKNKL